MPAVTVLYFASLRDRLGRDHEALELPAATTSAEVLALVARRHPSCADAVACCRLAVDQAFADGPLTLSAASELALIPPVSGG
jgi:molybdopterin converting factor subunit 1